MSATAMVLIGLASGVAILGLSLLIVWAVLLYSARQHARRIGLEKKGLAE